MAPASQARDPEFSPQDCPLRAPKQTEQCPQAPSVGRTFPNVTWPVETTLRFDSLSGLPNAEEDCGITSERFSPGKLHLSLRCPLKIPRGKEGSL
jgi:hypothetical protein